MEAQVFTIPWGNPREAGIEPKPQSMPSLEHSTVEKMIAERQVYQSNGSTLPIRD
jgi:hypothetical protein